MHGVDIGMKNIGFPSTSGIGRHRRRSKVRTAADSLLQSIELAVAVEELGADGAYFRVHHFARQLASPFPLLAAIGARTSRIEIGTGVIDMRYENPFVHGRGRRRGGSHRRRSAPSSGDQSWLEQYGTGSSTQKKKKNTLPHC